MAAYTVADLALAATIGAFVGAVLMWLVFFVLLARRAHPRLPDFPDEAWGDVPAGPPRLGRSPTPGFEPWFGARAHHKPDGGL